MLTDDNNVPTARAHLNLYTFEHATLKDVVAAINQKKTIENVDLYTQIKDPLFRFVTKDDPQLSFEFSSALSEIYKDARKLAPEVSKMGQTKMKTIADDYARKMHSVINEIKAKEQVSTFRETVEMLNKKEVPTFRGGKWHVSTLQSLHKRWKELKITSASTPKPK